MKRPRNSFRWFQVAYCYNGLLFLWLAIPAKKTALVHGGRHLHRVMSHHHCWLDVEVFYYVMPSVSTGWRRCRSGQTSPTRWRPCWIFIVWRHFRQHGGVHGWRLFFGAKTFAPWKADLNARCISCGNISAHKFDQLWFILMVSHRWTVFRTILTSIYLLFKLSEIGSSSCFFFNGSR